MKYLRVKLKSGRAYLMALYDNNKEKKYYGIRNSKLSIVSENVDEDSGVSKEIDNFQDMPLSLFDSTQKPSVIDHLTWNSDFGIIYTDGKVHGKEDEIINTNPLMLHELRRQGNETIFLLTLRQFERPHSVIGVDYLRLIEDEKELKAIKQSMIDTGNEINRIRFI